MNSQLVTKRLRPGEEDFKYDLKSVLGRPFHMDARKPVDRFLRYERVLGAKSSWSPLDFEGKRMVEIGCGPLFGWGPIAVYLGADEYLCIEPRFRPEVIESDVVWTRFFLPFHQQLDALFDRGIDFMEFVDRIRSRIRIEPVAIEDCVNVVDSFDIVFSNGVLNHIADLEHAVEWIQQVSHASTRQFHVVNFTDHMSPPDDPFREIYRIDPKDYFAQDSLLNLKRPSEIAALFERAGITVTMVPYYVDRDIETRTLSPYWSRFAASDLAVQIGFFVN